jgi:hypothetical protein
MDVLERKSLSPHQRVMQDVESYYDDQGWKSPITKMDEYKKSTQELANQVGSGTIDKDGYATAHDQILEDLNLISEDGKIVVPETEIDMYKDIISKQFKKDLEARSNSEKDPFMKDVLDALNIGSARVLSLPTNIMALSEKGGNALLKLIGMDDKTNTYFQHQADLQRGVVDSWAEANKRYDQGIVDALRDGNTADAVGQTILSVAETLPQLTTILLGNAAGATNLTLGYIGANTTIDKYLRNDKDPEISEFVKIVNALGTGLSEVVFENVGKVSILNSVREAAKKEGADVIKERLIKGYTPFFERQIGTLGKGLGPAGRESASEMATQFVTNLMDKAAGQDVSLGEGVADAGIVGGVIGPAIAGYQKVVTKDNTREYIDNVRKIIPDNIDAIDKMELSELIVDGDVIADKLENAPAAAKPALQQELSDIQDKTSKIYEKSKVQPDEEGVTEETQTEAVTSKAVENIDFLDKADMTDRVKLIDKIVDYLDQKAIGQLEKSEGELLIKDEGVFTYANAENLLGTDRAKAKTPEDIQSIKEELINAKEKITSEIESREGVEPAKEGVIRYGKREYDSVDELKEDLRKVENLDNLPLTMDIDVMRAVDEVKTERAKESKIKKEDDTTAQQVTEEVAMEEQPEVSPEVREGDTQTPEEATPREGLTTPPVTPPSEGTMLDKEGKPDHRSRMKKIREQRKVTIDKMKSKPGRKRIIDRLGEAVLDREFQVKKLLNKVGGKEADVAIRDINLRHGASSAGADAVQEARRKIFGSPFQTGKKGAIGKKQQDLLEDSIGVMRTIEIEENRNKKRLEFVKEEVAKIEGVDEATKKKMVDFISQATEGKYTKQEIEEELSKYEDVDVFKEKLDAIWQEAESLHPSLKHEGGLTLEEAYSFMDAVTNKDADTLDDYGLKPDDVDLDILKDRADAYYETLRNSLTEQYESGIIDKETYDRLIDEYPYYSPRVYMQHINSVDGDGGISGVKALGEGAESAAVTNIDALMTDNVIRSRMMAFNNRMLNSLAAFAKANPDNGFVVSAKEVDATPKQEELPTEAVAKPEDIPQEVKTPQFESTPEGMVAQDYFEDGVKKRWFIADSVASELFPGDQYDKLQRVSNIAGWMVGTPILKAAATGYNPEFAVKNIPLDALHQWMSTEEYSMWAPKAVSQMMSDMKTVAKDASTRTGRYKDFMQEGGGMEFLSDQGKFAPKELSKKHSTTKSAAKDIGNAMGYIGNTSEVLMRLTLRERALKNRINDFTKENGRKPNDKEMKELQRDATAAARAYIDFSQGGYVSKAANSIIPYLNAGMQVAATSARAIKKNPKLWAKKVGQVAGIAASATAWNIGNYPGGDEEEKEKRREAYLNNISPYVRSTNIIIMTPVTYKDSRGNDRFLYFKLPLDPSMYNIKNLAEDVTVKLGGGDAYGDYKLLNNKQFESIKALTRSFVDISSLPPLPRAVAGVNANYDDFYDSKLWVGPEYGKDKSQEFYQDFTPERFVALGKNTGISPVRAQYFMKQIFTGSNLFASAMGEGLDQLALKADPELVENRNKETAKTLTNTPFIRRFAKLTNPYSNDEAAEIKGERNKLKTINNRKLDEILNSDLSEDDKIEATIGLVESIMENDTNEALRINNRFHQEITGQDIGDNMFSWLMMENDASTRAELYHMKTKDRPQEQIDQMDEVAFSIKGLPTPSFMRRLTELREQEGDNIKSE